MIGTVKWQYSKGVEIMATSKSTTNYNLPIYAPDDVTSWLVTWNGAMTELDSIIANVQKLAEAAGADVTTVESAVEALKTGVQQLNTAVTKNADDITTANSEISGIKVNVSNITKNVTDLDSKVSAVEKEVGAAYKGVLSSTETQLTINVANMTSESMIDVYTSTYGIVPSSVTADIDNQLVKVVIATQEDTSVYPLYVKVFVR